MITTYNQTKEDENGIVYLNLTLFNNLNFGQLLNINRVFNEVIIPDASKYEVSLIRANIYTNDIPIIDMRQYLQSGSTTVYDLPITFVFGGIDYTRRLQYVAFGNTTDNDRYYIYSYSSFALMFNNTLTLLANDINTVVPGTITDIPKLQYVPNIGRFCLFAEASVFNDNTGTVQIWLDTILYNLLNSLPKLSYSTVSPKNFRLSIREVINPNGQNNVSSFGFTNPNYQMIQEYPSLETMNSCKSIIFDTDLPIVQEYDEEGNRLASTTLLDTVERPRLNSVIPVGENGNIFTQITYIPNSEYDMCSMVSAIPIYKIGLKAYWIDTLGKLHNMYISPRRTASFKIMFRRKK
jgi:hypothetical protein